MNKVINLIWVVSLLFSVSAFAKEYSVLIESTRAKPEFKDISGLATPENFFSTEVVTQDQDEGPVFKKPGARLDINVFVEPTHGIATAKIQDTHKGIDVQFDVTPFGDYFARKSVEVNGARITVIMIPEGLR